MADLFLIVVLILFIILTRPFMKFASHEVSFILPYAILSVNPISSKLLAKRCNFRKIPCLSPNAGNIING